MKRIFLTLLILNIVFVAFSQMRTIEGTTFNIGGMPLSGVKVSAKEAPAIFTLTNELGNYKLKVPQEVESLIFSYSKMTDKTVRIKELNVINVKLIPSGHKKFRFGAGFAIGTSSFHALNTISNPEIPDTISILLTPISAEVDFFYRINKRLEMQAVFGDGLNIAKFEKDSVTVGGDTINVSDNIYLNRVTISLLANFTFNITKSGNHSIFFGLGPQFQHLNFLKTNTVGLRIQAGANINTFGPTARIFLAFDVSSGKFDKNNIFVPGMSYQYGSIRFGTVFIF